MQEFSSISVSSYESSALADRLTEQSGDGWTVVAIVPTGSTVTAYLSRSTSGDHTSISDSSSDVMPSDDESWSGGADGTPETMDATSDHAGSNDSTDDQVADRFDDTTDDAPSLPDTGDVGSGATAMDSNDTDTSDTDTSGATGWGASGTATDTSAAETVAATPEEHVADTTSSVSGTDTDTSAGTADTSVAASASAAPAGWYADPSSRYELRYWDGGQWTEHVSRSGQQYTDPPVA